METETLRLFVDVAGRGSFVEAAAARGLSASAASRRIAQLEQELGARLLHRSTRSVALTEAGAGFLERTQAVLEELDEAAEEARLSAILPKGTLRVTASTAFGEQVLTPLLSRFAAEHPTIALDLRWTDANLDLVAEGIDLAVRLAPRIEGDFVATLLRRTRYRVCVSPGYLEDRPRPRRPEALGEHACVLQALPGFDRAWRFRRRRGRGAGEVVEVAVAGEIRSSSALSTRSLALAGLGPALLADWLIHDEIEAGRLVDLFPNWDVTATHFETGAWLVYPSRSYLPSKTRAMIDFLKDALT